MRRLRPLFLFCALSLGACFSGCLSVPQDQASSIAASAGGAAGREVGAAITDGLRAAAVSLITPSTATAEASSSATASAAFVAGAQAALAHVQAATDHPDTSGASPFAVLGIALASVAAGLGAAKLSGKSVGAAEVGQAFAAHADTIMGGVLQIVQHAIAKPAPAADPSPATRADASPAPGGSGKT